MIEDPPVLTLRRQFPRPTAAQISAFEGISTGFVCDAMGGKAALDYRIGPVGDGRDIECVAVGTAIVADNGPADVLATFGALTILQPGDMLVIATDGCTSCAALGDLVCGMARNAGAAGIVTDGLARDYPGIVKVGLPLWCAGISPNSPYAKGPGRVGEAAMVGGRRIASGDLIVADRDGVAVVPLPEIDRVIAQLAGIRTAEAELDAMVADGHYARPVIAEMLADGRARFTD